MTNFLHEAATIIRDLAIIVAALVALSAFLLSLRTRIDTSEGRVVIWRLPLFRHVTVKGQIVSVTEEPLLVISDAEHSDSDENTKEDATIKEDEHVKRSAWFHVPVIVDRSRDPISLPASSVRHKIRSNRIQLQLRYETKPQKQNSKLSSFFYSKLNLRHIYIRSADDLTSSSGPFLQLNKAEAGRLRDAMVGGWVSNLWS